MTPVAPEPFEAVLREQLALMESEEAPSAAADPIEAFRLATHRALAAEGGAVFPKSGHHVYVQPGQAVAPPDTRRLDIRS